MATREEILAELNRRGVDTSSLRAPTPTTAAPAGATPAPANYPAGMLDALKAQAGVPPRESTDADVIKEAASGFGRSLLNTASSVAGMARAPERALINAGMEFIGSDQRMGEMPQVGDEVLPGGQMAPGSARDNVRLASELAPAVLPFTGGAANALRATLGRGAARVGGGPLKAATAARVARSSESTGPAVYIPQSQLAKQAPEVVKKPGVFKKWISNPIAGGVVGAGAAGATDQDPLKGAAIGMVFNNPMGRWALSRVAKSVAGDKARVGAYLGTHPATRRSVDRLSKAARKWLEESRNAP